jgi:oligoendopeptidase F
MADILKERNEIEDVYKWDLTSLYADDAAWEKELDHLKELAARTAAWQGKLTEAKAVRGYFDDSTELERVLSDLFSYASLRKSEDTRDGKAQSLYARIYSEYVQAAQATAFADPEILLLPEEELHRIAEDPLLADYSYIMEKLIRQKAHTLSASEEKLLAGFGEVFAAPREAAASLQNADMVFASCRDKEGKETEVTGSNYILLQSSKDRTLRKNAFLSYYDGYRHHINTFAATYAGCVKKATAEAAARNFASSREMYTFREGVPETVYDNLIRAVRKFMPEMYRYVRLRKRLLGVDELHYYDLYAPLSDGGTKKYTYPEAKKMVLDAVRPLGEAYGNVVREGMEGGWIDVYPNKGKRGGAFSQGTYDSKPYILLNFVGTLDSVSTLAHEMGHSMHTWYANHAQLPQNAEYTIFVAEVASTVNENLLIEQLLANCTDPGERMALLNQYLEGFKGTVYRQTMFAEFEKEAHAMAERGEALSAEALNALYRRLIEDYFGPDLVVDDEVDLEWARIPHFYTPFYVYKYATSYSAAVALSEAVLREGAPAVEKYLEFLSMGGSRDPLEELKHAGVDLGTCAPIEAALEKFGRVLDEAEALADRI